MQAKKDNRDYRVYTVMGDGELAEGSVWEGFMAGHQYKLDNLLCSNSTVTVFRFPEIQRMLWDMMISMSVSVLSDGM